MPFCSAAWTANSSSNFQVSRTIRFQMTVQRFNFIIVLNRLTLHKTCYYLLICSFVLVSSGQSGNRRRGSSVRPESLSNDLEQAAWSPSREIRTARNRTLFIAAIADRRRQLLVQISQASFAGRTLIWTVKRRAILFGLLCRRTGFSPFSLLARALVDSNRPTVLFLLGGLRRPGAFRKRCISPKHLCAGTRDLGCCKSFELGRFDSLCGNPACG